jgi:hypothetical protein
MRIFQKLILLLLLSCNSNPIDRGFITFLNDNFISKEITNGSYILINSRGCLECEKKSFQFILENVNKFNKFDNIIVSQQFLSTINFPRQLPKIMTVDSKNKLETTTLPVNGVTLLRFKKSRIVEMKSIDPVFIETYPLTLFFDIQN